MTISNLSSSRSVKYAEAALNGEAGRVASALRGTRSEALNRAAFTLAPFVRDGLLDCQAVTAALEDASRVNGHANDDGISSVRKTIASGLDSGTKKNTRIVPANDNQPGSRPMETRHRDYVAATKEQACTEPSSFPPWTAPGPDGKPHFWQFKAEGPSIEPNELRRHIYRAGSEPVRIKIKYKLNGNNTRYADWYRVQRPDGMVGWQTRKPVGYVAIPYVAGVDPFSSEYSISLLYWPEGERDANSMVKSGQLAMTFGGCGDLPENCEQFAIGREIIILSDNDQGGREHAEKKAALCAPVAASVKVVDFPDTKSGGDVTDWLEAGHTVDELLDRIKATPSWTPASRRDGADRPQGGRELVVHRASEITPKSVEWLWSGRMAIGKLDSHRG